MMVLRSLGSLAQHPVFFYGRMADRTPTPVPWSYLSRVPTSGDGHRQTGPVPYVIVVFASHLAPYPIRDVPHLLRARGSLLNLHPLHRPLSPYHMMRLVPLLSGRQLDVFKRVVGHACKRAVSELMLEFDTGGNVRFEEGRPGDVWFSSCADLVKSRVVSYSTWHVS